MTLVFCKYSMICYKNSSRISSPPSHFCAKSFQRKTFTCVLLISFKFEKKTKSFGQSGEADIGVNTMLNVKGATDATSFFKLILKPAEHNSHDGDVI